MMEVVQVMYDTALYLSDEENEEQHGSRVNIQSMVERPYIRILTKSAGGEEEQLRHIPDRLKDLNSAAQDIPREHGGAIFDVFVAFIGDMSAWWFEAGVLRSGGSSYKCACGCGVRSSEIAFYNQNVRALPSLQELQSSATAGKYGKIPGRSLNKLTAKEAGEELAARGEQVPRLGQDRKDHLRNVLLGVVRVPALLARSPTANIKELGLEGLQIMPCEPLHDLKGVLFNTLTELERHLPASAADSYKEVIGVTVGRQHSRGCDWREAVCLLAKQATTWESCPQKAKHLLRNLADISSILYAGEEERKPKMVVRLTLLVWRCFALIRKIAGDSPKTCSREALYGGYLHDIAHAPTQLAVVNLLSCNTEVSEKIQGQAKAVALACTSRRHQDIPLQVLTRLQLQSQNAERGGRQA